MYSVYRLTLTPLSAFATPMLGDTLFGQLCWALREEQGEAALNQLLAGYTQGQPFAVFSDGLPANYFPRPLLPPQYLGAASDSTERKQWKKIRWIANDVLKNPVVDWMKQASCQQPMAVREQIHPHNTINRMTGTTGRDGFAPYSVEEFWYHNDAQLNVFAVIDKDRIDSELIETLFKRIGAFGFGRDASIGLGKFGVDICEPYVLPAQAGANAWLTLAPCAPQGLGYDGNNSYWQPFTRYGRHGNIAVLSSPFKNPVLLAATGSVFCSDKFDAPMFIGQGLGGDGVISKTLRETVQQGYTPVVGICLPKQVQE